MYICPRCNYKKDKTSMIKHFNRKTLCKGTVILDKVKLLNDIESCRENEDHVEDHTEDHVENIENVESSSESNIIINRFDNISDIFPEITSTVSSNKTNTTINISSSGQDELSSIINDMVNNKGDMTLSTNKLMNLLYKMDAIPKIDRSNYKYTTKK